MKTQIPFPSEFQKKGTTLEKIVEFHLEPMGHMVGGSKSIYRYDNPKNIVVFNSNVVTKEDGKIWYGDIDVTLSHTTLKELAKDLKKTIYVLHEMDARFENEVNPKIEKAVVTITPAGEFTFSYPEFYYLNRKGIPIQKTDEELEALRPKREPIIENQSDYEAIDLPNLKKFKKGKHDDPLSQLQKYFIDRYGKEQASDLYPRLYVTKTYYEQLEKLAAVVIKKQYPGLHPVKVEQSIGMYMLNMGPGNFQDKQTWEQKNTGYIRRKK